VTLLELVVVLTVLGMVAAMATPVLFGAPAEAPSVDGVVAAARASAIARAQTLRLDVAANGAWRLWSPDSPNEPIARGALPPASVPLQLEFTPLGMCLARTAVSARDAVRCTSGPVAPVQ
jgi:type II secretory pathway pseudopilin PulG